MSDWAVLDRADPAPGDVAGTRALGRRLLDQAGLVEHETARLRSLAGNAGELKMAGDYAAAYTSALTELPDDLAKLAVAYRGCGTALTRYADDLAGAQTKAGRALADGSAADVRYRAALRDLRFLLPPAQQALASSSVNLTPSAVETATVTLDESTREQIRHAAARARTADADLDQARALADQAAALRGDGEERAARGIGDALEDSGIKNKSWLRKAWDTVSKPFRSWDDFVSLCGKVALIAGTAALFISGPIGWALMAAALVAGAAIFANDLMRYSKGEVGLGTLAFDALGLIPGGRGVVSLSRWGKGLGTLGRALTRPGGFRTLASAAGKGLRNVSSAFPHALDMTKGIRGALKDPRLLGRALKCRFLGRDPIDMVTGEMVMQMTDFDLPGLLPIVLERTYSSAYGVGRWFGPSWSSFLDQRLEVDAQGVCFAYTEAVLLAYPPLSPGESALPDEGPRLRLTRRADGHYSVTEPESGRTFWFAPPPGELGVVLPLAAISDRNGNRLDLGYDPVTGWLAEIDHTGGYRVEVDCVEGRITEFRLAGKNGEPDTTLIRYGYDEPGRLTEVINSSGLPLRFGYDRHHRITSWTDRNGTWYRYTYDDAGRVIRTTGSAHCLDGEMRYDSANRVTVEVNSLGAETAYHYNEAGQVERVVDPLGRLTAHTWDRYHRKTGETDGLGRSTRFEYDERDDLVAVVRADGLTVRSEFDAEHRPVRLVQPDGGEWIRHYDNRGNLTAVIDPAGAVTRCGYDARGAMRRYIDPLGNETTLVADDAGRTVQLIDPKGRRTIYERDGFGRVSAVVDPLGARTSYRWTVEGEPSQEIRPDGTHRSWQYDPEGNLVGHIDPAGVASTVTRSFFDLPSVRTDPAGGQVAFTYDTELRMTSVTDARGLVWRYEYDPAGQLIREIDYDGRSLGYRYDGAGQLLEKVNGTGQRLRFERDRLDQVVRQESDGAETTFGYDWAGRLTEVVNPDAEVSFTRDPLGRVLSETVNGRTTVCAYDAAGRRTYRRTPSGVESRWEFDVTGRPSSMLAAGQRAAFGYDAAGQEIRRDLGGHGVLHQAWDNRARLTGQVLDGVGPGPGPALVRKFSYSADALLSRVDDSIFGPVTLALDPAGRVLRSESVSGVEVYAYDAAGSLRGGEREYTGARLSRRGSETIRYDRQGRVIARVQEGQTWRYEWDGQDRLRRLERPDGETWTYSYDGLGRRIGKQGRSRSGEPIGTVIFSWESSRLCEQQSAQAVRAWEWDPQTGAVLCEIRRTPQAAATDWFLSDPVGTPAYLVGGAGPVRKAWEASLWMVPRSEPETVLGFPGQYFDAESGLFSNGFRSYWPASATYLSPDPLGLNGGYNPYAYVANPTVWCDPLGLVPYGPLKAEAAASGSKKHGIQWKEGPARAKMTGQEQGQWGSAEDLQHVTQQADTLGPRKSGVFPLPEGTRSVVHLPTGETVPATHFWVRNNRPQANTWHGYPILLPPT